MLRNVETSTRAASTAKNFGACNTNNQSIHPPSSRSPQKKILNDITDTNNRLENFQTLESLSLRDLIKGDFNFVSQYCPESQEKIFTKLLEDLSRAQERVKGCIYDPYGVSKNHHLSQWVEKVVAFASEYSSGVGSWGTDNLVGPPQTFPRYGDFCTAWAPLSNSGSEEFLHVRFNKKVFICGLDIFETWNPGCVIKVSAFDGTNWHTLWSGNTSVRALPEQPRVFSPSFPCTSFSSNEIRIDLDCTNSISWTEIDAIRLRGRESYLWTPKTHHRYPYSFRQTVKVFLLCMNHLSQNSEIPLTEDVLFTIIQTLAKHYIDC